jgi:secreted trypsin-like serine protease
VYDVAILTLKTPEADDTSSATIGSVVGTPKVTVVGWGDTNPGPPYEPSRTLLKVDVSTVSRETCNAEHREYKGQIVDQHLCYGDAPKDSCHGDSGGPVMLQANKAVVGLISDGGFCGQPKLWSTAIRFDRDDIKKWIDSRATKTPTGPCFERPHQ